jgi:hypothetical protein
MNVCCVLLTKCTAFQLTSCSTVPTDIHFSHQILGLSSTKNVHGELRSDGQAAYRADWAAGHSSTLIKVKDTHNLQHGIQTNRIHVKSIICPVGNADVLLGTRGTDLSHDTLAPDWKRPDVAALMCRAAIMAVSGRPCM